MFNVMGEQFKRLRDKQQALDTTGNLLPFYIQIMTKVADCERCSVFMNDPTSGKAWLKAGTGVKEAEIEVPKDGSVVGKVIASGEPIIVSDLGAKEGAHKNVDEKTGFVTRNILCAPIKSQSRNEVTGAFQLLNKTNGAEFTDEDLSIVKKVAEHLQKEVDAIFLDQEIFGLSEQLYTNATRIFTVLLTSFVVAVVLVIAFMVVWTIAPSFIG